MKPPCRDRTSWVGRNVLDLSRHSNVSRAMAMRLAPALLRAFPMFVIAGLFLGLNAPPSMACAGGFALSLIGALILSSAITTLLSIFLFWTLSGEGARRLLPAAVMIFSGLIVPLPCGVRKEPDAVPHIIPDDGFRALSQYRIRDVGQPMNCWSRIKCSGVRIRLRFLRTDNCSRAKREGLTPETFPWFHPRYIRLTAGQPGALLTYNCCRIILMEKRRNNQLAQAA